LDIGREKTSQKGLIRYNTKQAAMFVYDEYRPVLSDEL